MIQPGKPNLINSRTTRLNMVTPVFQCLVWSLGHGFRNKGKVESKASSLLRRSKHWNLSGLFGAHLIESGNLATRSWLNGTSCMDMQPSRFPVLEVSAVGATRKGNTIAKESFGMIDFRSCKEFNLIGTREEIGVIAISLTRQGRPREIRLFVALKAV